MDAACSHTECKLILFNSFIQKAIAHYFKERSPSGRTMDYLEALTHHDKLELAAELINNVLQEA